MNFSLTFGAKHTPDRIFFNADRHHQERYLYISIIQSIETATPVELNDLRKLRNYPRLIAELIQADSLSAQDRNECVDTPFLALDVVTENLKLLPIFYDQIVTSMEATEKLFMLLLSKNEHDPHLGDLLARVRVEPTRLVRMTALVNPEAGKEKATQSREYSTTRCYESASWAFEYISYHRIPDNRPLDEGLVEALSSDEYYLFCAIWILRNRGLSPIVWSNLESLITSPRWACQSLRHGLVISESEEHRLRGVLLASPEWLVEYLVETDASPATIRQAYIQSSSRVTDAYMASALHHWFRVSKAFAQPRKIAVSA